MIYIWDDVAGLYGFILLMAGFGPEHPEKKRRFFAFYWRFRTEVPSFASQSQDMALSVLVRHKHSIKDGRVYVNVVKACSRGIRWEEALLVTEAWLHGLF